MIVDFHLHTTVSDGLLPPLELVETCARMGIQCLSITDHDALGAYTREVHERVRELDMQLVPGIEMDVVDDGLELHLLGFGLALDNGPLNQHLSTVQGLRRTRAMEQLHQVRELLGPDAISPEEALPATVHTVMKPHIIRALLARKLFDSYRDAKRWLKDNVADGVEVAKPHIAEGIKLLHGAGGKAVLAHPGYYCKDQGMQIEPYVEKLARLGLDGVETYYPYVQKDKALFTEAEVVDLQVRVQAACERLGLSMSRGSDCHARADFDKVYRDGVPLW